MSQDQNLLSEQKISVKSKIKTSSKYKLPICEMDYETECKKSNILHELMKGVWGGNFASPIEQELTERQDFKVLDVGCGHTCKWLLELSKNYPSAKFIGFDLSPLFPTDFSQNNVQFIQGDILNGLPFEDDSIDFVHMRDLLTELTERQWEEIVIKELVRVCKPGGWIELLELDVDGKSLGPTSKRLLTAGLGSLENKGINGLISEEIPEFFESTNQVEVYADEKYSPVGNWGEEVGKLAIEYFSVIFQTSKDLVDWLGVSDEEYENMVNQYEKEVEIYHSYFISLRFYCQKFTS